MTITGVLQSLIKYETVSFLVPDEDVRIALSLVAHYQERNLPCLQEWTNDVDLTVTSVKTSVVA